MSAAAGAARLFYACFPSRRFGRPLGRLMLMIVAMVSGLMAPAPAAAAPDSPAPRVLCTFFPIYQFTRNVAAGREGAQVELMLPPALGCPHDYILTPQDMTRIAGADILVINGRGLEAFLGEPLRRANPKLKVIDASRDVPAALGAEKADSGQKGQAGAMHQHEHEGPNPHVFSSPAEAAQMVLTIAEGLAAADPAGAARYRANARAYAARLTRLGDEFTSTVATLRSRKIVTEHCVFDDLARRSGLDIVAVVEEVPGQEPAAAEMIDLARRIKASGAAAVFTEPQYPAKIGQTLARETGIPVAQLDPVASGPPDAPLDYYETVMRRNLETLKRTLDGH